MVTVGRCDYSDLPKDQCDHCKRGIPRRYTDNEPLQDEEVSYVTRIAARYSSECPGCGSLINQGEIIIKRPDGKWVGMVCCGN